VCQCIECADDRYLRGFRPISLVRAGDSRQEADQIGSEICVGQAIGLPYRKE